VFVVASARKGFDPAAVLLEFEGLRRDTAPRREAGQAASGGATGRAGERSHWDGDFPHPTLNQSAKGSGGVGASNQELFSQRGAYLAPAHPVVMAHGQANAEIRTDGGTPALTCLHEAPIVAHSLRGEGFDASEDGTGRGTPLVPVAVPLQEVGKRTGVSTDDPRAGIGIGQDGDPMFTLQAGAQHGVAHAVAFHENQRGEITVNDTAGSLKVGGGKPGQGYPPVAVSLRGPAGGGTAELGGDIQNALRASQVGGDKPHVLAHMAVRRLTPVECERLQGFPDGYTNIPWRNKPEAPDGPRYKSLGNSMAVPCMFFIGNRIQSQLRSHT
jgi:DNA (cytosine-5)-methyltransferase 1